MAALMADGLGPRAEASDLEIRREGKSYTADTVEQLHEQFPDDELWLLMGTDMFLTVQNWYQPDGFPVCRRSSLCPAGRGQPGAVCRAKPILSRELPRQD